MVSHELSPADYANRQNLCEQMLAQITPNAAFFSSDEVHFHLSGAVNKQHFCYWAKNNPRIIHERPLHSPKLTVWYAVSQLGIIGLYFFEEEDVTVLLLTDANLRTLFSKVNDY
jgi:hypothetical protein